MNLDGYTVAVLQVSCSLLNQAEQEELDLPALHQRLEEYIHTMTSPTSHCSTVKNLSPCPTAGCKGHLEKWPKSSFEVGALVVGCRLCRYSHIKER